MTGKEILLKSIRNETTPRPAWVPFVGCHGAQLTGVSAEEYLKSSDRIVKGLLKACELYRPDGIPIVFDLQIEAEILGCELDWSEEGPPAVRTHPLEDGKGIQDLPVYETDSGRLPVVMEALTRMKQEVGDTVALYGLICGPFTLALHLMGNDIFMQMFDHPDYVSAVLGYCTTVGRKTAKAYVDNGADVVAVVDPMTSQISPEHFKEFAEPYLNQIFDSIRETEAYSSLFVCGDATRNLEVMSLTNCDSISIDENIPLEMLRDFTRGSTKSFGGNLKLTTALLLGDPDDCRLDAIRCIDVGGSCGFILAPGCDLPFNTPAENLQAASEMVHDEYKREVAKRTIIAKSSTAASEIEMPDYENAEVIHIDVVTLDSASCAPCQYMVDAVHRVAKHVSVPLQIREHRITTREGIAVMGKLGVTNIPSICIDGILAFSSIIPDQATLVGAINKRLDEKK